MKIDTLHAGGAVLCVQWRAMCCHLLRQRRALVANLDCADAGTLVTITCCKREGAEL
jgi:hypothetical protein